MHALANKQHLVFSLARKLQNNPFYFQNKPARTLQLNYKNNLNIKHSTISSSNSFLIKYLGFLRKRDREMMMNVFHQRSEGQDEGESDEGQDEGENDARTVESSMDLTISN